MDVIAKKNYNKEYDPIGGNSDFCKESVKLALGADNSYIKEGRTVTVQGISGTGSLTIGAAFLSRHFPGLKDIWVPTPTWGNHIPLFTDRGLTIKRYKYYDPKTCGMDFSGAMEEINVSYQTNILNFIVIVLLLFIICITHISSGLVGYICALYQLVRIT